MMSAWFITYFFVNKFTHQRALSPSRKLISDITEPTNEHIHSACVYVTLHAACSLVVYGYNVNNTHYCKYCVILFVIQAMWIRIYRFNYTQYTPTFFTSINYTPENDTIFEKKNSSFVKSPLPWIIRQLVTCCTTLIVGITEQRCH